MPIILFTSLLMAQVDKVKDNEFPQPFQVKDSTLSDTLLIDTTRAKTDLDTIVIYSAENVFSTFDPRITVLTGNAKVSYKKMQLSAHKIEVFWEHDSLIAEGILDTMMVKAPVVKRDSTKVNSILIEIDTLRTDNAPELFSKMTERNKERIITTFLDSLGIRRFSRVVDSTGADHYSMFYDSLQVSLYKIMLDSSDTGRDSIFWKGLPKMRDADQTIDGEKMFYNIKTRKGSVIEGDTKYEDGFCHGTSIKKVDEDVLNIRSGYYTTCDLDHPHYHFWSHDLKLVVKDKVIARPVVLHFGPVPVMIIPFAIFPARGGRHSGVVIPTYGESASQGRYFRDLGYYWAPNDYMDVKGMLDFYERYGTKMYGNTRYIKRYRFNGNLSGSMINMNYNNSVTRRWDVKGNHRQTLSPSSTLNMSGEYQSDASYQKDLSSNPYDRMKREMNSNATYSKSWPGTPYSGSVNVSHREQLTSGEVTQWMPQINFSRQNLPIIPQPEDEKPDEAMWYNKVYFKYDASGKIRKTVDSHKFTYTEMTPTDTFLVTDYHKYPWSFKSGIQHRMSLTGSQEVLEYFTLSPRFSYTEDWFDEWLEWQKHENGKIDSIKHEEFIARRTYSAAAGLSTTLYGLFTPGIFGIEALRHKIDPSLTFTYSPDFSDPYWNYYDKFWDYSAHRDIKKDRFYGNLYGSTPSNESMTLSMGLGNLFQYKRVKGEEEIKGDLFDLNLGTSYNFAADSLHWSNLTSSLGCRPRIGGEEGSILSGVTINLHGSHSFYAQEADQVSGRLTTVHKPAPGFIRLINYDAGLSFKLSNGSVSQSTIGGGYDTYNPYTGVDSFGKEPIDWGDTFAQEDEEESSKETSAEKPEYGIPWSAGFGFNYSENHNDPNNVLRNITGSMRLSSDVTKNWNISYSTSFDFVRKVVTQGSINIRRDLHCWEGTLNWTVIGASKGYYLRIGIKSPQLKDVKVEKQKGRSSFGGF
ncbi:hypothetical protein K9N50_06775 [bacterium]|nr:hypothetical protein [bacterium]